jgi:hypothetical protein
MMTMPFAEDHLLIYEHAIRPALVDEGLAPIRCDHLTPIGSAVDTLRMTISASDCCIAVMTGCNPNVMYEVGLAHAWAKPVILLCQYLPGKPELPELPFDLRGEYVLGYGVDMDELRRNIGRVLRELFARVV